MNGGDGNDYLYGRWGSDTLVGGAGSDIMDGGDGYDVADFSGSSLGVTLDFRLKASLNDLQSTVGLQTDGMDTDATGDKIANVETVIATGRDDTIHGEGSMGILAGDGNDTLYAGSGVSSYIDGGAGNDRIMGGASNGDALYGGDGNDVIGVAGGYDSEIYTGEGSDTVWIKKNPDAYINIWDSSSSDNLVWNGYAITGGETYILDQETTFDANGNESIPTWLGYADEHGVNYTFGELFQPGDPDLGLPDVDEPFLSIRLPDGSYVQINGWVDGDYGISFTGPTPEEVSAMGAGDDLTFGGRPMFSNANDGVIQGFDGARYSSAASSAISSLGPVAMPTFMV